MRALSEEQLHVSIVADKMARGALMGARSNSGVILSQILRGFAWAGGKAPGHPTFRSGGGFPPCVGFGL
ncbi:MAG: DAK2 domain-containing protein [Ardenticatenales bacterium]|nr:DAK2 domain-containing protein [Ardenticatenales bacterium]